MTLDQLRIFVAVAERQHVTRAAEALNLTQSAVSSAITTLEGRHGVALFDRVGRSIVLNAAGQVFLEEARAVLARASAAEDALDDLGALKRGRLSIQASQTIAGWWLPARLAAFHARHPGIRIDVAIGNTRDVAQAVIDGRAELGLVEGEVDEAALTRTVLDHDELVLVVAADHSMAQDGAGPPDLKTLSWVLREPGSGTRSAFEAALAERGLTVEDLDISMTLPGNEAVAAAVAAGVGATVVSRTVVAARLRSGEMASLPLDLPARPFWLLRHKQRYRSKAGETFLGLLPTS
ncbi:HTH-type transcriptional regulator CysL [Brevundimonas subvibrioides]|jgi:DNA-binding transcriptional LysR family regulator|uniref:LysR substrate-binding domain-containing protein n=1 Tax=Brevundimonas subvibrioides TaxID=74313 RepID=UPI0032D5909B